MHQGAPLQAARQTNLHTIAHRLGGVATIGALANRCASVLAELMQPDAPCPISGRLARHLEGSLNLPAGLLDTAGAAERYFGVASVQSEQAVIQRAPVA